MEARGELTTAPESARITRDFVLSSNVAESSCVCCFVHVAQREETEPSKLESVLAEREWCSHVLEYEQRIRVLERENALLVEQLKRAAEDRRALEDRL